MKKTFVDSEEHFNSYLNLAQTIYHRVCCCTSCDDDFKDDSLYHELCIATLVYNHFCDCFVENFQTPDEYLSMQKLVNKYDRDPEYAYAYLKQFEALLDKFHAVNDTPLSTDEEIQ